MIFFLRVILYGLKATQRFYRQYIQIKTRDWVYKDVLIY